MLEPYSREKEAEVKKFWEKNDIVQKVRAQNKGKKPYFFIDGPPYASGHIHMGTALNKISKDVSIRSRRMTGHDVRDQPGYDTHGVPIEHMVEQQHNFKVKQDIENYGIDKFVNDCKDYATKFIDTMNKEFEDLGVWMDWDNPYLTLDNEYIEGIWWTFKQAHEKKLLYMGQYSVHVCPRCETAVAYNEIVYKKVDDPSIYVRFKLLDENDTYFLIWTTTPWTMPGNIGVMAHPDFDYAYVKTQDYGTIILAKDLVEKVMKDLKQEYEVVKTVKGKDLKDKRYECSLKNYIKVTEEMKEKGYKVVLSKDYVNLEEGTGLVHIGSGHGREDFEVSQEAGLPILVPVEMNGLMNEKAGKYNGMKTKGDADATIVEDLTNDGLIIGTKQCTHDYPHCWRCITPLIMLAVPQWYFKISGIEKRMLELNDEVKWIPHWGRDRFRNWLDGIGDWPISRARYWGTPLPLWRCDKCEELIVVESREDLAKHAGLSDDEVSKLNLHKPWIDEIKFKCKKCDGTISRVPEVLDVWFDSGVCSWASLGYPKKKEEFEKFWPPDLNLEGKDQIRGWWNSELITSVISFDKKPYKAIMMHGMVLDVEKRKMSKSLGNIVSPSDVIDKYNRDYLRFNMIGLSKGEDFAFDWGQFKDIHRFFNTLWNVYNFTDMYLNLDVKDLDVHKDKLNPEDKWILSKLNSLIKKTYEYYNEYLYFKVTSEVDYFVLEELSRTYIKLIRDRTGGEGKGAVEHTLNYTIMALLKVLAPITPHITEFIYQTYRKEGMEESIHMCTLPEADEKLIDANLEKEMDTVKELSKAVLALREENKLRLRWPLREAVIMSKTGKEVENLKDVMAKMCNVEKVVESTTEPKGKYIKKEVGDLTVHLNIDADSELKEQWELRELLRRIQDARKQKKLNPKDKAHLLLGCSDKGFVEKFKKQIEEGTNVTIKEKEGKMEKLLDREFYIELE